MIGGGFQIIQWCQAMLMMIMMVFMTANVHAEIPTDLPSRFQVSAGQSQPTLIEFYADWCSACRRMFPIVDGWMKAQPPSKAIRWVRVNVDNPDDRLRVLQYEISGTPSYFLYDRSHHLVYQMNDTLSWEELKQALVKVQTITTRQKSQKSSVKPIAKTRKSSS